MKSKRYVKMFYKFLVNEGVLFQYIENIQTNVHGHNTLELIHENCTAISYLSNAFIFDATNQGFHFWGLLHAKWKEVLKQDREQFKIRNLHKKYNKVK